MGARGHTLPSAVTVLVNGTPGYELALTNCEHWHGSKASVAVLEYRAAFVEGKLIERPLYAETSTLQVVEVLADSAYRTQGGELTVGSGQRLIHKGSISSVQAREDDSGPYLELVSVLKPCHYGGPLKSYPAVTGHTRQSDTTNNAGILSPGDDLAASLTEVVPRPLTTPYTEIFEDIVFNPEVNGRIVGNRAPGGTLAGIFIDPAQSQMPGNLAAHGLPTNTDRTVQLQWNLALAVLFITEWLNPAGGQGSLVRNPDPATLGELSSIRLENLRLRIGAYLPECLEALLSPFGFDFVPDFANTLGPTIKIFKRGNGPVCDVFHQAPLSQLLAAPNHAEGFSLNYDTTGTINSLPIIGSLRRYELTVNLIPKWDYTEQLKIEWGTDWHHKLTKGSPEWASDPRLEDLLRTWVANEGGSCIGNVVRFVGPAASPELAGQETIQQITAAFDLPGYLGTSAGVFSVRNRKPWQTITANPDMTPIGPHGGYLIEVSVDGGREWFPISQYPIVGSVVVLEDEIGVRFDDPWPAFAIQWALSGLLRVRLTCSIDSDDALFHGANGLDRFPASVAGDVQGHVIHAPDKFFFRRVTQRSVYHAAVRSPDAAERLPTTECDDELKMAELWAQLRVWNQAECDGSIPLPTLSCPAEIGQIVPKIDGVNVGLATTLSTFDGGAPSIIGIAYDNQGQQSRLVLNSFKGKVSL